MALFLKASVLEIKQKGRKPHTHHLRSTTEMCEKDFSWGIIVTGFHNVFCGKKTQVRKRNSFRARLKKRCFGKVISAIPQSLWSHYVAFTTFYCKIEYFWFLGCNLGKEH